MAYKVCKHHSCNVHRTQGSVLCKRHRAIWRANEGGHWRDGADDFLEWCDGLYDEHFEPDSGLPKKGEIWQFATKKYEILEDAKLHETYSSDYKMPIRNIATNYYNKEYLCSKQNLKKNWKKVKEVDGSGPNQFKWNDCVVEINGDKLTMIDPNHIYEFVFPLEKFSDWLLDERLKEQ